MKYKTLTPEGIERKKHRIMCRLLKQYAPEVYCEMEDRAIAEINSDNTNKYTRVSTRGVGKKHHPTKKLVQAIVRNHDTLCTHIYGNLDAQPNRSLERLLGEI